MSLFTEYDHARLATLFNRDGVCNPDGCGPDCTHGPYPGYRPEVREAPNGDTKVCPECGGRAAVDTDLVCSCHGTGRVPNVDAGPAGKRFLHVALKYNPPAWAEAYLARAHWEACKVAQALGVSKEYFPMPADGTLRVLEYPSAGHVYDPQSPFKCANGCGLPAALDSNEVCPALAPGAGTAEHTDFDLFTIVLWRSTPGDLQLGDDHANQRIQPGTNGRDGANQQGREHGNRVSRGAIDAALLSDATPPTGRRRSERGYDLAAEVGRPAGGASVHARTDGGTSEGSSTLDRARLISPGLHIGELGELVGLGPATPHRVPARPYAQKSVVYFAMPDHAARLPRAYEPMQDRPEPPTQTVGEWLRERVARSRY